MEKQDLKGKDKEYHPPETLDLNYQAAVLGVVSRNHPLAREYYDKIKWSLSLAGPALTRKTTAVMWNKRTGR